MTDSLRFEPLYFADQLTMLNPVGTVGIVTLWSRVDYVLRRLEAKGVDLNPQTSPIAALGTLYGNGLRELLRNLLYNPQIDTLLILGRNRSGSAEELVAFFRDGLEPHGGGPVTYEAEPGYPTPISMKIRGTTRILDSLLRPEDFQRPVRLVVPGNAREQEDVDRVAEFLADYRSSSTGLPERKRIPLPRVRVSIYPSNPRLHTICASDALSAWKELIFRLYRFGIPVQLAKGDRRELQNVKVVVERPDRLPVEALDRYGLSESHLECYQRSIMSPDLAPDETYAYGHRLKAYFGLDGIDCAIDRLRKDPEDRKSYVALWDARRDLQSPKGHPCLVSLYFRVFQEKLTLTAVFRTHNALDAWLVNFYGLMAIRSHVAGQIGRAPGAITIFSHSITIDTKQTDRAALIAAEAEFHYTEDPTGYFRVTLDGDAVLVEHRLGDVTLKVYRHSKASHIQHEIYRDCAVSDISHAIYLGRQLARAEMCLREGKEFIQE
jgi:thymidylate synthase